MKSSAIKLVLASVVSLSVPALASGFRCESRDGYRVQVYNHTNANDGTRVPAALIVSYESSGTLLAAKDGEITKHNLSNVVQYSVKGPKGGLTYAVVQIAFKEGKEILAEGERAYGTLILAKGTERQISRLVCTRYKKQ